MANKKWTKKTLEAEEKELKRQDFYSDDSVITVNKGGRPKKSQTARRTALDLTIEMLAELDELAEYMNVSRQAAIKALIMRGLDDHYKSRAEKKKA